MGNSRGVDVKEIINKLIHLVKFNKLTHNCASWSVLGVVGDADLVVQSDEEGYGLALGEKIKRKDSFLCNLIKSMFKLLITLGTGHYI